MNELTITIPGRPPTPNARGNPAVQWRRAKDWRATAKRIAEEARPDDWSPLERCRLVIEFLVHDRRDRDWDNLIASTKPLTDGIQDAGIIAGDDSSVIADLSFRITYVRGVKGTVYHLTPLDPDQLGAGL